MEEAELGQSDKQADEPQTEFRQRSGNEGNKNQEAVNNTQSTEEWDDFERVVVRRRNHYRNRNHCRNRYL